MTLGGVRFARCERNLSLLCSSLAPTKAIKSSPVPYYPHSLCLPPNLLLLNEPWLPHCRGQGPWNPSRSCGEPCMDDGNLKKIPQNIRADDCHCFTHNPERFKLLLSIVFASDIAQKKYLDGRNLFLIYLTYKAFGHPRDMRNAV